MLLVCVANAASIEDLKIVDKATIEDTVVEVTTETTPEENKVSESTTEVPEVDVAEPRVDVAVVEDVAADEVEGVGEVLDVAEPRKGQLISKCLFAVIVLTKIAIKKL